MKKILFILALCSIQFFTNAQTMNRDQWCIHSITNLIDSNGVNYTLVQIENHDTILEEPDMISIGALLSNNGDTLAPNYVLWDYWISIQTDTIVTLRIDTTIAQNLLGGVLIQRGQASCGMFMIDSANVQRMCEGQASLGIKDEMITKYSIYPNPVQTVLQIDAIESDKIRSVVLRNSLGQIIMERKFNGLHSVKLDIRTFAKGIYLLSINQMQSQKIKIE